MAVRRSATIQKQCVLSAVSHWLRQVEKLEMEGSQTDASQRLTDAGGSAGASAAAVRGRAAWQHPRTNVNLDHEPTLNPGFLPLRDQILTLLLRLL
jgi:hypothetical protein